MQPEVDKQQAPPSVVSAVVEPQDGDATVHLSRASIPWHHKATAWGIAAAVILICGLLSGWLISSALRNDYQPVDPAMLDALRAKNAALREQIDRLQKVPPGDICKPGVLDDLNRPPGTPPGTGKGAANPEMPHEKWAKLLDDDTALVIAPLGGNSTKAKTGSGFFIGSNLLVTNAHVVQGTDLQEITVTSVTLGKRLPAKVLAQDFIAGLRDFAVLEVEGADRPEPLQLRSTLINKFANVWAAGYPGYEHETACVVKISGVCVPDMRGTSGSVAHTLQAPRIEHSARIDHGNSGGPLVDACGHVAGVNTFMQMPPPTELDGSDVGLHLNFALSSLALIEFLTANHAKFDVSNEPCE